ncbi:hypothetical protein ACFWW0_24210, partial [Streptomyces violascens]
LQPPQGWTTQTHSPTRHTLTPPAAQDSQPHELPPAGTLTFALTNYPAGQPGASTLHLTETPHPSQQATGNPQPLPLTLTTWPTGTIVNPPTLNKNRYNNGDTATLEWEYSPADGIDYTLTYYPQPQGTGNEKITVTYAQIQDNSGSQMDNGLRHAVYTTTVPLTTDPVLFILTATYQNDTRTYTTIASVGEPDVKFGKLQVSGHTTLLSTTPETLPANGSYTTPTEGFLVCWTAETHDGDKNKLTVNTNGETRTLFFGNRSTSLTAPLGENSSVSYTADNVAQNNYSVTWIPLGHALGQ